MPSPAYPFASRSRSRGDSLLGDGSSGPTWDPSALGASLAWWHDAADTDTITDTAGAVSQIDDKGARSNHLAQAVGSKQPTTGTRTLNGLNVLDNDSDDNMSVGGVSITASHTVLMVCGIDTTTTNDAIFALDATNDYQLSAETANVPNFLPQIVSNNLGSFTVIGSGVFNGPSIYCVELDAVGSTMSLYIDGSLDNQSGIYNGNMSTTIALYAFTNRGGFQDMDGFWGEFFAFELADTDERQNGEGYLAHKWGLTAQLPPGHPYKTEPP